MNIALIIYDEQELAVEIMDVFESGGQMLAAVRALAGKPFVGGDKWPIRTEWGIVPAPLGYHTLSIGINPQDAYTRAVYGLDMQAAAEAAK